MSVQPKIYTRTGDGGDTSLYGGKRVEKYNAQVVAYGTIDELNSQLGVVISFLADGKVKDFFSQMQGDLFSVGAHLAGAEKQSLEGLTLRVKQMEQFIDEMDKELPPLKNFVLPGGTQSASFVHVGRSVCRRAEREVIRLSREHGTVDVRVIMYLNRLSDFLFQTARYLNKRANVKDIVWKNS
jgi:cob(I)alamin adenosyltransferase